MCLFVLGGWGLHELQDNLLAGSSRQPANTAITHHVLPVQNLQDVTEQVAAGLQVFLSLQMVLELIRHHRKQDLSAVCRGHGAASQQETHPDTTPSCCKLVYLTCHSVFKHCDVYIAQNVKLTSREGQSTRLGGNQLYCYGNNLYPHMYVYNSM